MCAAVAQRWQQRQQHAQSEASARWWAGAAWRRAHQGTGSGMDCESTTLTPTHTAPIRTTHAHTRSPGHGQRHGLRVYHPAADDRVPNLLAPAHKVWEDVRAPRRRGERHAGGGLLQLVLRWWIASMVCMGGAAREV